MDGPTDNLTPAQIQKKTFGSRLRGVDPSEVTAYLERIAAQLGTAETDRDAWQAEVERLRDEVRSLQESLVQEQAEPDEAALTEQLGQEAGRVLTEARSAAADRLAEAEAEAADIIAAAEELHAERSRAADAEAERVRAAAVAEERRRLEAADDEAGTIRDRARVDAESIRADAGVDQQAADAEGARIIREAELTRRRILEDLARRRTAARRQIEQLRAGRERLLASHEVVRRALEEISEELNISMSEARAAAETAGHNVSESTLEEIEAEIETAKLAGLLDTGPLPVVTPKANRPVAKDPEPTMELAPIVADAKAEEPAAPEASEEPEAPETTAPEIAEVEATDEAVEETDAADDERADATAAEVAEPAEVPSQERPDIGRSADADSDEAGATDADGPLAEVVSLTAARQDVDTDRHPANRRPPKKPDPDPEPVEVLEPVAVEEPEPEPEIEPDVAELEPEPDVAELEPEPEPEPEIEPDVAELEPEPEPEPDAVEEEDEDPTRVDSLFARMRQTQDAAVVAEAAEGDSSPAADAAPADGPDPRRLTDEVGRKLKRVLADEQSDVLSTLRGGADDVGLDELLGSEADHRIRYWSVTEAVLGATAAQAPDAEAEVGRMVDGIRRRVDGCLTDVAEDRDAVIDRLRSVYREVKTQRIGEHAQIICGAVEDLNAS